MQYMHVVSCLLYCFSAAKVSKSLNWHFLNSLLHSKCFRIITVIQTELVHSQHCIVCAMKILAEAGLLITIDVEVFEVVVEVVVATMLAIVAATIVAKIVVAK